MASEQGHSIQVFTAAYIVCRPPQREAEDYFNYFAAEHVDEDALNHLVGMASSPSVDP